MFRVLLCGVAQLSICGRYVDFDPSAATAESPWVIKNGISRPNGVGGRVP